MMWRTILGWTAALWVAAGVQTAVGGGLPGPVAMVALAAGLLVGPEAGALVGMGAGLLEGTLAGRDLLPLTLSTVACGVGAGFLTRRFAGRNPLVGLAAALIATSLLVLLWGLGTSLSWRDTIHSIPSRSVSNALSLLIIYGIVFVVSSRVFRRGPREAWE